MASERGGEWVRMGPEPLDLGPRRRPPTSLLVAAVLLIALVIVLVALA